MTEDIQELFSESGAIGRLSAKYSKASFADETLYAVAERMFSHFCGKDGTLRVCNMDEYSACRDKDARFLAGDVIWRAQSVTDPKRLGVKLNRCVTSLASLCEKCTGFCIDVTLAGGDTASDIAENTFFVLPADIARANMKKYEKYAYGLCECGIVTCDGAITFLRDGEEYLSGTYHELTGRNGPESCAVRSVHDYRNGCLAVFSKLAALNSPAVFEDAPVPERSYSDPVAYRLGLAAAGARGYKRAKHKVPLPQGRKKLNAYPLPCCDGMPDLPAWHYALRVLLKRASVRYGEYAAAVCDCDPSVFTENGYELECESKDFAATGYIAITYRQ
ncbi:MAG: hypothetical protein IJL41_06600 [Clostridia bacterium]|nr:hypothetical protein [Clostridia bacterium]